MKMKLDENLSRYLKSGLEQYGHDAWIARDEGLLGKSDVEVGAAAEREGRMVFTLDLDFGDLRKFAPGTHPGVVVFKPVSMGPQEVRRFMLSFVRDTDLSELEGCVVIVDPARVRVRRPPIDADASDTSEQTSDE